jgi:hypothetical protein
MLAEELKWMLAKGWHAQYRHETYRERITRPVYESKLRSKVTHGEETNDLWGGSKNAELGAWNEEAADPRAV